MWVLSTCRMWAVSVVPWRPALYVMTCYVSMADGCLGYGWLPGWRLRFCGKHHDDFNSNSFILEEKYLDVSNYSAIGADTSVLKPVDLITAEVGAFRISLPNAQLAKQDRNGRALKGL